MNCHDELVLLVGAIAYHGCQGWVGELSVNFVLISYRGAAVALLDSVSSALIDNNLIWIISNSRQLIY